MSTIIVITPPPVKSRVLACEQASNIGRKFGAGAVYFCAYLDEFGELVPLLFTEDQIEVARGRAATNPEDIGPPRLTFREWLKGLFG